MKTTSKSNAMCALHDNICLQCVNSKWYKTVLLFLSSDLFTILMTQQYNWPMRGANVIMSPATMALQTSPSDTLRLLRVVDLHNCTHILYLHPLLIIIKSSLSLISLIYELEYKLKCLRRSLIRKKKRYFSLGKKTRHLVLYDSYILNL